MRRVIAPFVTGRTGLGVGDELRSTEIRQFLERRRSPLAGAMILSVALVLTTCVGWTAWARVDEVVRASGSVEPTERVMLINHPRGGRVATLDVREGQRIEAGQQLLTFAPEVDAKEHAELLGRLQVRAAEVARLQAEINGTALMPDQALLAGRSDLIEQAEALIDARERARDSERDALLQNAERHGAEIQTNEAEVVRLEATTGLLTKQFAAVRELGERGLYPRLKVIEIERQLTDAKGELAKAKSSVAAARAGLAESKSHLASFDQNWHRGLLEDLSVAMAERDRLVERLAAQSALMDELSLFAPSAGIVQELKPAVAGQSLAANETIMKLVPTGNGLMIKALVDNADIGRVTLGMESVIKVHAYDFARFGTIEGRVQQISADAIAAERPGDPPQFSVEVVAARDHVGANGSHPVLPGMAVDVELRVGDRTILSYLTDPLIVATDSAFKDR